MESSTDSTGVTTYLYDADGSRLIRWDPAGHTLFLLGQELRVNKSGTRIGCTRYYQHGGQSVAMRTLTGVTWLAGDHQSTSRIAIDAATQSFSLRRQDPYGNSRGDPTGAAWPAAMDKGLVGGTLDDTGLTHLGAREYDPLIGRFISADPIVNFDDPVQVQGYAYANHSPVTSSDPDGLSPIDDANGPGTSSGKRYTKDTQKTNPHKSDAEERRATANSAETQRIRQVRNGKSWRASSASGTGSRRWWTR